MAINELMVGVLFDQANDIVQQATPAGPDEVRVPKHLVDTLAETIRLISEDEGPL